MTNRISQYFRKPSARTTSTASAASIRDMTRADLDEVGLIEQQCQSRPWTRKEWLIALAANDIGKVVYMRGNQIAGYVVFKRYTESIMLINLSVFDTFRRQGVASSLIELVQGRNTNRHSVMAVTRESNISAQLFFRSAGFAWVRTLPDYFESPSEDGYVMQCGNGARKECEGM